VPLERSDLVALIVLVAAGWRCVVLWRENRRRAAHVVWMAALVAVGVPFFDLHAHTHWAKVQWIPFVTPPVKLSDIVANVLLYIPLGFLSPASGSAAARSLTVIGVAAALSTAIEFSQVFSHTRFPSTADILCNVAGALAGMLLAQRRLRRD
jgi:glycopeptide antibiotics resistance protein